MVTTIPKSPHKKIFVFMVGAVLLLLLSLHLISISDNNDRPLSKYFSSGHRRHPVSRNNVSQISVWMTFDYINKVFDLPDSYLKESLQITSKKYPLVTLGRYAKEIGSDPPTVVQKVKNSVEEHLNAQLPK